MILLRNQVHLNEDFENILSYNIYNQSGFSNSENLSKVKTMLTKGIENLLTEKQRKCIVMHYFEKKPMKQIAKELGVCPSTVTRTIQLAKKRLSILSFFL